MKRLLLAVGILTAGISIAQTNALNREKYWKFRNNFKENFIRIGTNTGQSLPAGAVQPHDCIDNNPSDGGYVPYGQMHWGDGMIRHGHYLALLATEYAVLRNSQLDVSETLNELYYALEAINRLDRIAETNQDQFYNLTASENLNGFFLREDIPEDFVSANWGETNLRIRCANSVFYKNNNYLKQDGIANFVTDGNTYQNVPSLDQITSLMVGFSLIDKLVDDIYVQPTPQDQGFQIVSETKAIVHRIITYLEERNWFIIDMNGWPVANGGGDFALMGFPILIAAHRITGYYYNTSIDRRTKGYNEFQSCLTGYSLTHELTSQEKDSVCMTITPGDMIYADTYLDGSEYPGPYNNQNNSVFLNWQAGGTGFDLSITEEFWNQFVPIAIPDLYDDWVDDHKFNSTIGGALGHIKFDRLNWTDYNNTILFNAGILLGSWDNAAVFSWAEATGNRQLELINAVLYGQAPIGSDYFYRNFLDSMDMSGAFYVRGEYWQNDSTTTTYPKTHLHGWASEYRWTHPEEAYAPNSQHSRRGIFSNLDYMVYHNLYHLLFSSESAADTYTSHCITPQVSTTMNPSWPTATYMAVMDLNTRLSHIGFTSDAFEDVDHIVTDTFRIQPYFPDYIQKGIFPVQTQHEHATVESSAITLAETKFAICKNKVLTIEQDGQLVLQKETYLGGDLQSYGSVTVMTGSKLHVWGNLFVRTGGALVIQDGAEVIIHKKGNELGTLTFFENGSIIMEGPNAKLTINGRVRTFGTAAEFKITHSGTQSGKIVLDGTQFLSEAGTGKFIFEGKNKFENHLTLAGDILIGDPDITELRIKNTTVHYRKDAYLYTMRPIYMENTVNIALDGVDGITFLRSNSFANSEFYNIPFKAELNSYNDATLILSNCIFERNDDDLDTPNAQYIDMVTVTGRGFNVSNTAFHGSGAAAFRSLQLTLPSQLTSCQFSYNNPSNTNHNFKGLIDNSNVEIKVTSTSFNYMHTGIDKWAGKLSLKCNSFSNSRLNNIRVSYGCFLNMSTYDNGNGYNILNPPATGNSIYVYQGNVALNTGYNKIFTSTLPVIAGITNVTCPSGLECTYYMQKNQWNTANTVPLSSVFDLRFANNTLITINAQNPTLIPLCGTTPGTGTTGKSLDLIVSPVILYQNDSIPLHAAIEDAMSYMSDFDSTGNDLTAVNRFDEILSIAELNKDDESYGHLVWFALSQMKRSLENLYLSGQVQASMTTASYEPASAKYASALTRFNDNAIGEDRYKRQFYLEMDKVQFFLLLQRPDLSLNMLSELEKCGLELIEQNYLNDVKERVLREIALSQMDLNDSTIVSFDSIQVDTNGFNTTVVTSLSEFSFGSDISDLNAISYPNCSFFNDANSSGMKQNDMEVFPNPSTGNFTVKLKKGKITGIKIVNAEGKVVHEANGSGTRSTTISVNLKPGAYILQIVGEDGINHRQTLIIE